MSTMMSAVESVIPIPSQQPRDDSPPAAEFLRKSSQYAEYDAVSSPAGAPPASAPGKFAFTPETLRDFFRYPTESDSKRVDALGGLAAVAEGLCTSLTNGLPAAEARADYDERKAAYVLSSFGLFVRWFQVPDSSHPDARG